MYPHIFFFELTAIVFLLKIEMKKNFLVQELEKENYFSFFFIINVTIFKTTTI